MTTKLEIAKNKLERLVNEREVLSTLEKEERSRIPFGQPNITGRSDIYAKANRLFERQIKLSKEIEKQQNFIEKLEKVEKYRDTNELVQDIHVSGCSSYAQVGAKTSVNNLDFFKAKLADLEQKNTEAKAYNKTKPAIKMKTYGAEITKLKNKIKLLETMKQKAESSVLSEKSQRLIDEEKVTQWKKKPIYYFVKGLKKVALEVDSEGDFFVSSRYPATTVTDTDFIDTLLSN